jgi:hypothetical protein
MGAFSRVMGAFSRVVGAFSRVMADVADDTGEVDTL